MDEAEYCGRISIMHAGKIIEIGKPQDIVRKHGEDNLEDTFMIRFGQPEGANA